MSTKSLVESAIADNRVVIFSKSWCPYCRKAKGILADEKATVLELDEREDGDEIQAYLLEKTGQRTVPNIFINQKHVGGSDDLAKAKASGELPKLLAA